MSPGLEALVARTVIDDRVEEAERFRRARAARHVSDTDEAFDSVTVRRSYPDDAPALRMLAERDGRRVPPPPVLVAEVSGRLLAARSLHNGASISDPFQPTAHLVELLALRSAHLREVVASPPRSGRLASLVRRLAFRAYPARPSTSGCGRKHVAIAARPQLPHGLYHAESASAPPRSVSDRPGRTRPTGIDPHS